MIITVKNPPVLSLSEVRVTLDLKKNVKLLVR